MEFTSAAAKDRYAELVARADQVVVGLDFDGVLSPIVEDPAQAHIHEDAPKVLVDLSDDVLEPGQDPPVHGGQLRGRRQVALDGRATDQRVPGGVPQLVAEVPRPLHPLFADRHVGPGVGPPGQREPGGVEE